MKKIVLVILAFLILNVNSIIAQNKSENGRYFTPRGDLRVMVICVTFSNWCEDPYNTTWPCNSPLPTWATPEYLFSDTNTFRLLSLEYENTGYSNYFYQMTKQLPDSLRLRIYGEFIPVTIELPNINSDKWEGISRIVLNKLSQNTDFLSRLHLYDNRIHTDWENDVLGRDGIIDYVIFCYRYAGGTYFAPYGAEMKTWCGSGGGCTTTIDDYMFSNGYKVRAINIFSGIEESKNIIHETGHAMFHAPHYGGCNGVTGKNLHVTKMGGMMPSINNEVYGGVNAWERWYLGWIDIKNDLTENDGNGEYYLDDYFTTGDAIRIKLPYSNQYLWLENHQGISLFEQRIDWKTEPCNNDDSIASIKKGLIAYIEDVTDNKEYVNLMWYKPNEFKLLHREGNFDVDTVVMTQEGWSVLCNTTIPIFKIKESNAYSGYNKASNVIMDFNHNGEINYSTDANIGSLESNDIALLYSDTATNGYIKIHGNLGTDAPFQVGDSIGICTNPAITNIQKYHNGNISNSSNQILEPIYLNGVSVKILEQDANGRMKIRVRFDDYDFNNDVRMCGDIVFPAAEVNVNADITMDKSGTTNRTKNDTARGITDFINPSIIKTQSGSHIKVNQGHNIIVKNRSTFVIDSNSTLEIMDGAKVIIDSGATLVINPTAKVIVHDKGVINIKGSGYLCVSPDAEVYLYGLAKINLYPYANTGVEDYASFRGYGSNCSNIEDIAIVGCGNIYRSVGNETKDSTEIWNSEKLISEDFVIKSGHTLTIKNTIVKVTPNTKIIVEPSAKLIVENSKITNLHPIHNSCYNWYWGGIILEGTSDNIVQEEQYQGKVYLSNAMIENARTAISTIGYNEDWSKTGGIIQAKNTIFKNNNRSVEFLSFANGATLDNKSYFTNCTFTWTDSMIDATNSGVAHMTMWQVRGIRINGCQFRDERSGNNKPSQTHGIIANESGYIVKESIASNTALPIIGAGQEYTPTKFDNLTYGIRVENAGTKECNISKTIFSDNFCGVYASASNNLNIVNNTFNIVPNNNQNGNVGNGYLDAQALGLFVESSNNYAITNNDFIGIDAMKSTCGIQIKNSVCSAYKKLLVENNYFKRLFIGSQALGTNRGEYQYWTLNGQTNILTGLTYKCNKFEDCKIGIYSTEQQCSNCNYTGINLNQGSLSMPVRNEFVGARTYDIYNHCPTPIRYYAPAGTVLNSIKTYNVNKYRANNSGVDCGEIGCFSDIVPIAMDSNITPILPPIVITQSSTQPRSNTGETQFGLVEEYLSHQDYKSAMRVLNSIAITEENAQEIEDYKIYVGYLMEFGNALKIPEYSLMELEDHQTIAGAKVRGILYFRGIKTDYHPSIVVEEQKTSPNTKSKKVTNSISDEEVVTVSPNPANDNIVVTYSLEENANVVFIICDMQGKEIIKESLQGNRGEQTINISKLSLGIYYYKVLSGEEIIKSDKLVIIK